MKRKLGILVVVFIICAALVFAMAKRPWQKQPSTVMEPTSPVSTESAGPVQRLMLDTVTWVRDRDEGNGFTAFSPEALNHNFHEDLIYSGFTQVDILLDGDYVPFHEAIRDGMTTIEEVTAYARIDARNGFCKEYQETENGLTYYRYEYPQQYHLVLQHDVYETPDGQQHQMDAFVIATNGRNLSFSYPAEDGGEFIDREDWGLTFAIQEITPTQLTLTTAQTGGQQAGQLHFFGQVFLLGDSLESPMAIYDLQAETIVMDGTGSLTLDISGHTPGLEPGDYTLQIAIEDVYDPEDLHPLMRKFHDRQSYTLAFTVEP